MWVRVVGFMVQMCSRNDDKYKIGQLMSLTSPVSVSELMERHVEEAADVLTRSFLQLNTIWKVYSPRYEEVFPIMRGKVYPTIGKGWSYVLTENTKVIGVCLQYDMVDYLAAPAMPSDLALFTKLGQAGQELERQVNLGALKRGDGCYGLFGVIDPDFANRGYSLSFWWECFARGKVTGWKYYYSRISSPVSYKMLLQLGAETLAETTVKTEAGEEKLWMIRISFDNPLPTMTMMRAMAKPRSKRPEASL